MSKMLRLLVNRIASVFLTIGQKRLLNSFAQNAAGIQNAVDIFKGEWISKLPDQLDVQAGTSPLFEDKRIVWAHERFDFTGKTIIELGPLEGGHAYMAERLGASHILAIEANTRAYLRCLIVKELLELKNAHFLCEDFVEHLRKNKKKYDLCIASGVLYHMQNPIELIELISTVADRLFLWTHYYDQTKIQQNLKAPYRFRRSGQSQYKELRYTLYRREYGIGLFSKRAIGGTNTFSHWLTRNDILAALEYFDMGDIHIAFDEPDNPHGPSFALTAIHR